MILERQEELRKLLDLICPYMVCDTQDRRQLLQMVRIKELGNEALDTIKEQHDGMLHATNAFTELSVDRNYRIEELNKMLRDLKDKNARLLAVVDAARDVNAVYDEAGKRLMNALDAEEGKS